MKNFLKITTLIIFIAVLLPINNIKAVTSLNKVSLSVSPKAINSMATWTVNFTIPQETQVGHVLISFGGFVPDLSQASLNVSGLPQGTAKLGKTNPSCVSNCDDIRYYFTDTVNVKKNTDIVFTINNVKNSDKLGQTGINFISVFDSKYPKMDLAFSASDHFVTLTEDNGDELIPDSVTTEGDINDITKVMVNELFYQERAKTTKLDEIENSEKVEDFTLDLIGKAKVVFKEPIDLSDEEAVHFIANIADYMTFDYLYFWVAPELISYFRVPIEITFYNLPYVWEPAVLKDNAYVLLEDEIENFKSIIVDNQAQISFIVRETGGYNIVPKLELYIQDNQEIKPEEGKVTITGRISDDQARLNFSLNNQELNDLIPKIDPKSGEFSFSMELEEGANLIKVEAESEYGQVAPVTKVVQYHGGTITDITTKKGSFNPLYYFIIGLGVLALFLVGLIIYLMKTKR